MCLNGGNIYYSHILYIYKIYIDFHKMLDYNTISCACSTMHSPQCLPPETHWRCLATFLMTSCSPKSSLRQIVSGSNKPGCHLGEDVAELKANFGFMIVMGVNRLPEIRDYRSLDSKLNNAYISSRITRKRNLPLPPLHGQHHTAFEG